MRFDKLELLAVGAGAVIAVLAVISIAWVASGKPLVSRAPSLVPAGPPQPARIFAAPEAVAPARPAATKPAATKSTGPAPAAPDGADRGLTVVLPHPVDIPLPGAHPAKDAPTLDLVAGPKALLLDGKPVTREKLPAALEAAVKAHPGLRLVIAADDAMTHGQVVRLLDAAKQAGITRIALAASPEHRHPSEHRHPAR